MNTVLVKQPLKALEQFTTMAATSTSLFVFFATAGIVVASVGCGSADTRNDAGIQNVARRAEFELQCPRNNLRLAALQYDGDVVSSYAVMGCGKRAVYVRSSRDTFSLDPAPRGVAAWGSSPPVPSTPSPPQPARP